MTPRFFHLALVTLLAAGALIVPAPVEAQDQGASPFRQFGSWLDDASAPTPGLGQTTVALGHWKMPGVSQTNLPMLSAGIGVSDHLQVTASVPFYRTNFDGVTASGMDDSYIGAKYNVIDPTLSLSEIGLSIGSFVEIVSAGAGGRLHFVLPVSIEMRRAPFRWYASAGYFSRGAVFSAGAIEWAAPHGVTLTGSLTGSYSTQTNAVLDARLVGRQRVDVSAGASHALGNQASTFVNVGKNLSSGVAGTSSMGVSGGISFWFRTTTAMP
jgi:hypothetical protein